jgi:hypothetical protein
VPVSWAASTDNVGVTGYGVYRNGALLGSASSTSYSFAGLVCGTSYTFAVDAFDAAGNRSSQASVNASTSACSPSTGASVYLSPSGSDSNSCSQSSPCQSFARGYRVAQAGQVVEVAAGTYANQSIGLDSSKTSTTDVTIRPASGASVIVGSKPLSQQLRGGIGLAVSGGKHVTVRDMTIRGDVEASGGAEDVTFENLTSANGLIGVYAPTRDITFRGGSYGNTNRYQSQIYPAANGTHNYNFTIDGTTMHDVRSDDLVNYHVECMLVSDAIGAVIRNMHTYNCDVFDVSIGVFSDGILSNVLVENNMFSSSNGSGLGLNTNTTSWNGLNVRNNSSVSAIRHPDCSNGCSNVRYSGNISPLPGYYPAACVSAVTYSHNVWTGGTKTCSSSDKAVSDPGFVNAGANNLHLLASSPAINFGDTGNYPSLDIDGQARPMGPAPDAGADEAS